MPHMAITRFRFRSFCACDREVIRRDTITRNGGFRYCQRRFCPKKFIREIRIGGESGHAYRLKAAAHPATDAAGKHRTLCHCGRSRGPFPRKRESYVELRFDYRRRRCGGDDPRGPQNSSLAFGDSAGGEAGRQPDVESLEDGIHCNLRPMRDPGLVWADPPFHGLRLSTERALLRGRLRAAVFLWAESALATDRLDGSEDFVPSSPSRFRLRSDHWLMWQLARPRFSRYCWW